MTDGTSTFSCELPEQSISGLSLIDEFQGMAFSDTFPEAFQIMAFEAGVPEGHIVEVVLSDSKQMIELKKEHFNIDKDTDVIAFPVDNPMLPPGFPAMAGELFLGIPEIKRNAMDAGWSFSEEFFFVLTHGLLHICGWDDDTDTDREMMFAEQKRIMEVVRSSGFEFENMVRFIPGEGE